MIHLPDVQAGDKNSAALHNRELAAIRRAANITVSAPLNMIQGPGGTVLSVSLPPKAFWQATVSTSVASLTNDPTNSAAVAQFDTVDTDLTHGGFWGTLASGALPISNPGRYRSVASVELMSVNPDTNLAMVTAWLQRKPSGGSWADVPNSAGRATIHDAAATTYPSRITLDQMILVAANDSYRVKVILSNGPAAAALVGNDAGPLVTETIGATTMWNLELL